MKKSTLGEHDRAIGLVSTASYDLVGNWLRDNLYHLDFPTALLHLREEHISVSALRGWAPLVWDAVQDLQRLASERRRPDRADTDRPGARTDYGRDRDPPVDAGGRFGGGAPRRGTSSYVPRSGGGGGGRQQSTYTMEAKERTGGLEAGQEAVSRIPRVLRDGLADRV